MNTVKLSEENLEKIKALLGFALKSRSVIFGYDNIKKSNIKKNIIIVLVNSKLSERSMKNLELMELSKKYEFVSLENFEHLGLKETVKVVGVTNEDLANRIKKLLF